MAEEQQQRQSNHWLLPLWIFAFGIYYLATFVLPEAPREISYTEFVKQVETNQVHTVLIRGRDVRGRHQDVESSEGKHYDFHVVVPELEGERLLSLLEDNQVVIEVRADEAPFWLQLLSGFLPWLLIIGFFFWSSRSLSQRMGSGGGGLGGMYGFGRSRARRHNTDESKVSFEDVAGLESAKDDLWEIVDYLKNPQKYQKFGANMPRVY